MERKRKLPARAAARAEQAAKRRTMTPPQRSATPAPAPEPEPTPVEDIPPPLPKSITAGKPLPTVDSPQPDHLSSNDFQTVTESGVLSESLSRSRLKWTMEGIFEKYWSKPTKKKGVVIEEPNNPPKESMMKIGQVTITVEPHVFEATMFAVKDPKPPPPPPPTAERPVVQYGPPNGTMPPPPTPTPKSTTPTGVPTPAPAPPPPQPQAQGPAPAETKPPAQMQTHTPTQTPTLPMAQPTIGQPTPDASRPAPAIPPMVARPIASPRGMEAVLSPSTATPHIPQSAPVAPPQPPRPTPPPSYSLPTAPTAGPTAGPGAGPPRPANTMAGNPAPNGTPTTPAGAPAKTAPGTDPIILMLAEKAGSDPQLRDLMKRVAQGEAQKHELERFQAIIDAITAESKRNGSTAGPSADRLLVDGRTVRYFADEVRAILDIVLSSNPKQTSADLRPPVGSDTLVVMLVKAALDDPRTRDMVRRIAENKTQFADATDLKVILDRLRTQLAKDKEQQPTQSPASGSPAPTKPNSVPNGHTTPSATTQSPAAQTALRSKGPPPPPPKPDISSIVFEFAGGTGDRYLFPKFSLLEYVPVPTGQQVIASFLLVRRGSKAEYPMADPELDYYQPLTVRLFTHAGRHLEHLARVVAPPDEVRRYMDDVMTKMTRAEYILLAMRLPRRDGSEDDRENDREGRQLNGGVLKDKDKENGLELVQKQVQPPPSVLWTTKPPKPEMKDLPGRSKGLGRATDADEQYQSFIASVSRKEV
ncbi:hypothetical protein C8A01DRAFT_19904 [Parachaetomium inaequale]|uniref:SWR1-complex protein 3 domain-containing protein n=1 Tax=Parachaetomium inaequale TaxID=2588326 RepID=A0AAN6P7H1_9PEZI|nr:hypothetical protein C8A01DRAFT_19904 [Parachaetomium inaequale]